MKIYKSKVMRIINFAKNEGKFERGDMVRVHNVLDKKYKKYNDKLGYIVNIDYSKKECMFEVKFEDKKEFGFNENELVKINYDNPIRYKKLDIEY